jgi:nitroreductase
MSGFTREEQLELVRCVARAPSVHNVQPARWRFVAGGEVQLHRAMERALPAADPSGRDVRQSLGAAFEGMALALSRRGLALGAPVFARAGLELVATARVTPGRDADPLAELVERRRAFRGRFDPANEHELSALRAHFDSVADVRLVLGAPALDELARRYDRASYGFLSQPAYWREFHGWCRFLRSHPDYARDGLNADCLALSATERLAASVLLRPWVFALMRKLGLGAALVSEAVQIRSSAAVVLFAPRRDLDPFDAGRRFYRVWLELTALGLHACPLSALADARSSAETLEREHGIPPEHALLNAFRVGPVRRTPVPQSARLPQHELLLD